MGLATTINNLVFRRTSTFAVAVAVGVFFFERTFDLGADIIFEKVNEGKLWKDIKHNYEK